jgi:hypothetical protein
MLGAVNCRLKPKETNDSSQRLLQHLAEWFFLLGIRPRVNKRLTVSFFSFFSWESNAWSSKIHSLSRARRPKRIEI